MIPFLSETLGWRFLLALVLSVTLWARLTLDQNPERRDVYPTEVPVEVRGLPSTLVVANVIPPVKLRIAAPQESWRRLQASSFRATVDLSSAGPGLVQPEVHVDVSDPDVRLLEAIPSKTSMRIEELRTITVPVRINQIGSLPFGYRLVGEPVAAPPKVEVSGPSSAVEKVTEAAVAVRMEEVKSTIDRSLKPEPRGPNGVVTDVRLEPQSVTATVHVEQIAGSKTVPVVPQIRGQPAAGYWQAGIAVDPPALQIVGDPSQLEAIAAVSTAEVDIGGAQADVVRTVPLARQPSVTFVRDQTATVRVGIQPVLGQQVRDVAVSADNLPPGLAPAVAPATVSVTISGPQPALLRLATQDLVAGVDAAGLPAGTHSLTVAVRVPDTLRVTRTLPDRVTLTLAEGALPP